MYKHLLSAAFLLLVASPLTAIAQSPAVASSATALSQLAQSHEAVFKNLSGDDRAIVLQKGEKQFVIYGVAELRAAGSALEVTVKNGRKYSVNPHDIFFLTDDAFGLK